MINKKENYLSGNFMALSCGLFIGDCMYDYFRISL